MAEYQRTKGSLFAKVYLRQEVSRGVCCNSGVRGRDFTECYLPQEEEVEIVNADLGQNLNKVVTPKLKSIITNELTYLIKCLEMS